MYRSLPPWRFKTPPAYPRGVVQTDVARPRWEGTPTGKEEKRTARTWRETFEEKWTEAADERAGELYREFRMALRWVDRDHYRALWQEVRAIFDYPVFTAAPEQVGITSTGADGPNQLPQVLAAYRQFETWLNTGTNDAQQPAFS